MPDYSYFKVSGVRTFVRYVPNANLVKVQVIVESGSQEDEIPGQAHFLEHVAGSRKNNKSFLESIRLAEQRGVDYNAWTTVTHTSYYATGLTKDLEHLVEHVRNTLSPESFSDEDVERERQAIIQEIQMYNDQPDFHLRTLIMESCFGGPFSSNIIGTIDSVKSIGTEDLKKFLISHTTKDNIIIVFSGGVGPERARSLVERFFLDVSETSQTFEKIRGRLPFCGIRQWKISKFDQAQVALSIILPENISEVGFHIFQIALSYGFSSPLFDMIRNKMKIAYSINAAVEHFSENSIFTFYGNTSEKNIFDLMGGCKKALVQLMNNPENEIERVKKVLLLSAAHAQNSIIGNPEDNLFFFQRNGDFPPVPNEIENLANHIKPEIIKKHAEIILDLLPFAAVSVIGGIPQLSQEEFSKRCEAVLTNID